MATVAEIDGEQIDDIAKVDNCDVPPAGDIAHDTRGIDIPEKAITIGGSTIPTERLTIAAGATYEMASKDVTVDAISVQEFVAAVFGYTVGGGNFHKTQLEVEGVMKAETGFMPTWRLYGIDWNSTKGDYSGAITAKTLIKNYDGDSKNLYFASESADVVQAGAVFVGSVKLV